MKHDSVCLRRTENRSEEQEGMEERLGEMMKGSHCFFKSSGYDKLELNYQNLVFFQAYRMDY